MCTEKVDITCIIAGTGAFLHRPVGRPPRTGVQVSVIEFHYQAESWNKPRRFVYKIELHMGELFPRVSFIATNSSLEAQNVTAIYNIKEGTNTLRWDKTSCHRFAANQARLLVGCLAYNLLHMIRDAAFWGESVKPSIDSIIRRLVKVGARVVYHTSRSVGYFHIASAFPLARYYRILFGRARHAVAGRNESTNCGEEVCPKIA